MTVKIPPALISLSSQILPDYLTHAGIDGLFLASSAPQEIPEGSKPVQVKTWRMTINNQCAEAKFRVVACSAFINHLTKKRK
jgi:hypothetical protein